MKKGVTLLFFMMMGGALRADDPQNPSPITTLKDKVETTVSNNPLLTQLGIAGAVGTAASWAGAVGGAVLTGVSPLASRVASHFTDKVFNYSDRILDKSVEGHLKIQEDAEKQDQKIQEKGYRDPDSLHYFYTLDQQNKKKTSFWMSQSTRKEIKLENAARDLLMLHAKDLPLFQKQNRKSMKALQEKLKAFKEEKKKEKELKSQTDVRKKEKEKELESPENLETSSKKSRVQEHYKEKKEKLQALKKSLDHGVAFVKEGKLPEGEEAQKDIQLFERRNDAYLDQVLKKYQLPPDQAEKVLGKVKTLRGEQEKKYTRGYRKPKSE